VAVIWPELQIYVRLSHNILCKTLHHILQNNSLTISLAISLADSPELCKPVGQATSAAGGFL